MVEAIHEFIKFAQNHDMFVSKFVGAVKICCVDFYSLYCDSKKMYTNLKFKFVIDLVVCTNDGILVTWWTNVATFI